MSRFKPVYALRQARQRRRTADCREPPNQGTDNAATLGKLGMFEHIDIMTSIESIDYLWFFFIWQNLVRSIMCFLETKHVYTESRNIRACFVLCNQCSRRQNEAKLLNSSEICSEISEISWGFPLLQLLKPECSNKGRCGKAQIALPSRTLREDQEVQQGQVLVRHRCDRRWCRPTCHVPRCKTVQGSARSEDKGHDTRHDRGHKWLRAW